MPELTPDTSLGTWTDAIAAGTATPAGGAAAAIVAALAAALAAMVAKLTGAREKYTDVHYDAHELAAWADRARGELLGLARRDAETLADFLAALALPRGTDDQRARRDQAKQGALLAGAGIQNEVLRLTVEIARGAEAMVRNGLASAIGDAATASFLCTAASRSAYWSIRSNLRSAGQASAGPAAEPGSLLDNAVRSVEQVEAAEQRVRRLLEERL